jgi:acyl-coenzyme A thioesterase PaaI-like protein
VSATPHLAIQDALFPDLNCFGCGPANAKGLRLKSYWEGEGVEGRAVAGFEPWPEHDNGIGYLNGGIIATVLDCHSAAAVVQSADLCGWRAIGDAPLPYVTAGIDVHYRRPTPLHGRVDLVAEITEASEDQMTCAVRIEADGKTRAEATALWKRWRPRG